jgi:hypothetical protein
LLLVKPETVIAIARDFASIGDGRVVILKDDPRYPMKFGMSSGK